MTIEKAEDIGNIKYFRIEIIKCQNTTDKDLVCKSPEEIEEKTSNLFFQLKFIDNFFDVGNYSQPTSKYINNKSVAIKKNTLSNIYLNFLAVNIITRDGFIFDSIKTTESYAFDFHSEAFTATKSNKIHETQFWILSNAKNYERSYLKLQNIAAEIGGLYKLFFLFGSILNYIFEKYTNFLINDNLLDLLNIRNDDVKLDIIATETIFQRMIGNINKPKPLEEEKIIFKSKDKRNSFNEIEFANQSNIFPTKIIIKNQLTIMKKKIIAENENQNFPDLSSNFDNKSRNNFDPNDNYHYKNKRQKRIKQTYVYEDKNDFSSEPNNDRNGNLHYLNRKRNPKNVNNDLINHSNSNNNFSSFNLLEKNEERNLEKNNFGKTLIKGKVNNTENLMIVNNLNQQNANKHNIDFNLKGNSFNESREKILKFLAFILNAGYGVGLLMD
jgi:hypothetical protein